MINKTIDSALAIAFITTILYCAYNRYCFMDYILFLFHYTI